VQNDSQNGPSSPLSSCGGAPQGASGAIPRVDALDLLGSGRELIITLQNSEYRLRLTSKGKLILTK
jgi:hemin uptake protein HemP